MQRRRILVIGAGIAGLTAAISLSRAGHDVTVFDQIEKIQPVGAGITLWSNAVMACRAIGIEKSITAIGIQIGQSEIRDQSGATLATSDITRLSESAGAPTLALHRADLQQALIDELGREKIMTGKRFNHFVSDGHRVQASFEDGTQYSGDLLIGADGIWSQVREQLYGHERARYAGYTAWRGIAYLRGLQQQATTTFEAWGRGKRFGYVPLSENRVYWFAVTNAPPNRYRGENHQAVIQQLFGTWHSSIPEVVEVTESTAILNNDIIDRPPISNWGSGPVTLIGDAAHPVTPNLGQGACLGIEDALVLTNSLNRNADIDAALRAYESARQPRTAKITNLSWRIGQVAQADGRLASRARNLAMRAIPARANDTQIQSIITWEPEIG